MIRSLWKLVSRHLLVKSHSLWPTTLRQFLMLQESSALKPITNSLPSSIVLLYSWRLTWTACTCYMTADDTGVVSVPAEGCDFFFPQAMLSSYVWDEFSWTFFILTSFFEWKRSSSQSNLRRNCYQHNCAHSLRHTHLWLMIIMHWFDKLAISCISCLCQSCIVIFFSFLCWSLTTQYAPVSTILSVW